MKKLFILLLLTCLPSFAWVGWNWHGWEFNGLNTADAIVVHQGGNNIYPTVMATPIGQTTQDGSYLITISTVYSPLYITNSQGEVIEADDASPNLRVNFQQIANVTNGVITLAQRTYNNSVVGSYWHGANLSTNVGIQLMTFTNGSWHQMFACFVSDGTRDLLPGGEVYKHIWTNWPSQPHP